MKGSIEELLYFAAIFFAVFMLFIFLTYQMGTRGAEVRKVVEERLLTEGMSSTISSLFNNKLPIGKTYMEAIIDAFLQGSTSPRREKYRVYYGASIGELNVMEVVPPLLRNYTGERWELKIITSKGEYSYGKVEKKEITYTYEVLIPVPEQEVGKIVFLLGKK